jgi:hypothetical protein
LLGNIQDNNVFTAKIKEYKHTQTDVSPEMYLPVEDDLRKERTQLVDEFFNGFDKINSFWKPEYII